MEVPDDVPTRRTVGPGDRDLPDREGPPDVAGPGDLGADGLEGQLDPGRLDEAEAVGAHAVQSFDQVGRGRDHQGPLVVERDDARPVLGRGRGVVRAGRGEERLQLGGLVGEGRRASGEEERGEGGRSGGAQRHRVPGERVGGQVDGGARAPVWVRGRGRATPPPTPPKIASRRRTAPRPSGPGLNPRLRNRSVGGFVSGVPVSMDRSPRSRAGRSSSSASRAVVGLDTHGLRRDAQPRGAPACGRWPGGRQE